MVCKKCGSQNVTVQVVTETKVKEKKHGILWWICVGWWIPPLAVIAVFESEGFIWGGKWGVWDNMHFEYRPELILLREYRKG